MAATNENNVRRVVPRLRSFSEALRIGELDPARTNTDSKLGGEEFLRQREREWMANKSILFATDLVAASHVLGASDIAKQAAEYILESPSGSLPIARRLAASLLGITEVDVGNIRSASPAEARATIKQLKQRRLSEPRNAYVWADLAKLYVTTGLLEPAHRAMRIALALAPYDRFVIRNAVRIFLHSGEKDRALTLLRRNERTKLDPWLMAAELAVSAIMEKGPKFGKDAEAIIAANDFGPFHMSELASALASTELWNGKAKRSQRLFAQSLIEPTENALAQGVWAAKSVNLPPIPEDAFSHQPAPEAHALFAHAEQDWQKAFDYSKDWARYESFSARPYLFASSIASSFLDHPDEGVSLAEEGLLTNPGHGGLINNQAFCLVLSGKPAEARKVLQAVDAKNISASAAICLVATEGLIEYRTGSPESGRILYKNAIQAATRQKLDALRIRAMLYFAREELMFSAPGAESFFEKTQGEALRSGARDLVALAALIKEQIQKSKITAAMVRLPPT